MPISHTIFIKAKVGELGTNNPDDVMAVQRQLNDQMQPPRQKLTVDGKCGKLTIAMIRDFQKGVCGFSAPDGRVDPGGKTLAALNNPQSASVWARMSVGTASPGGAGGQPAGGGAGAAGAHPGLTGPEQQILDKAKAQAMTGAFPTEPGLGAFLVEFLDQMVAKELQTAKLLLSIQGLVQLAVETGKLFELAKGLRILSDLNYGNPEATARSVADMVRRLGAAQTARGMAAAGHSARVAKALKGIGNAAMVLGIIFAAFEVVNHLNARRYGEAAKETYKALMGIAVPWAAAIDALQAVVAGLAPGFVESRPGITFFKYLRCINPLDHGGNAVDAMVTIIGVTMTAAATGKLDYATIDALVGRMEKSSGAFLVEIGNTIGDHVGSALGPYIYEYILK